MKGGKTVLGCIISFILGGTFGAVTMCLFVAAGNEDERRSIK